MARFMLTAATISSSSAVQAVGQVEGLVQSMLSMVQSGSSPIWQPPGQQSSAGPQVEITSTLLQTTSHIIADPEIVSMVHALLSSQSAEQSPSQVSPSSIIPLPHSGSGGGPMSSGIPISSGVVEPMSSSIMPMSPAGGEVLFMSNMGGGGLVKLFGVVGVVLFPVVIMLFAGVVIMELFPDVVLFPDDALF